MTGRSLFYAQPLLGSGTSQVESLRSYIERLALEHNLTPSSLVDILIGAYPLEGLKADVKTVLRGWRIHGGARVGEQLASRFRLATGVDVSQSTLGRFKDLFAEVHFARANSWLYCPCCVAEEGAESYGRLLWEVQGVVCCPLHRVRLRSGKVCGASTEARLRISQRPSMTSVCAQCGSVGFRCIAYGPEAATDAEVLVAEQVGALLALSMSESAKLSRASIQRGLHEAVNKVFGGSPVAASRLCFLARASVWNWVKGYRPALAGFIQFAIHANCDVVELMCGRLKPTSDKRTPGSHRVVDRTYSRSDKSSEEIRQLLILAAKEKVPPSVHSFARGLGLEKTTPGHRFPREAKALAAASGAYRRAQREEKYQLALEIYDEAGAKLAAEGATIGAKSLQAESKLVAFSQNATRVRALNEILAKYRPREDSTNTTLSARTSGA